MADRFDQDAAALNAMAVVPMQLQMAQAEFNQAVTTAHAFPRSPEKVAKAIMSLATMQDAAQGCIYSIPRKDRDGVTKQIVGPSIRFAEIVAACWGNCNVGARIVGVDRGEKVVIVEGVFWDLESGSKRVQQTQRNISTSSGKLYSADMITVTANAAMSIALREAILRGVPRAVWWPAYKMATSVIAGDAKTMEQNRKSAMDYFEALKVSPARIFAALEVNGLLEIGLDQIVALRTMAAALREGESTIEALFPSLEEVMAKPAAERAAARAAVTGAGGVAAGGNGATSGPATAASGPATVANEALEMATTEAEAITTVDPQTGEVVQDAEVVSETKPQTQLALGDSPKTVAPSKLRKTFYLIARDLQMAADHSEMKAVLSDYAEEINKIEAEDEGLNAELMAALKAAEERFVG